MEKQNDKPTNPRKGGKTKDKVTDASRKSWVQKEEVALLNALKEMVIGRGEKIGKDSFKAGYLKKLEGMLVVALPGTEIRAYPHIASKIKRDSNASGLRYKTFPYYEDWCIVFGNDRATGEMAESAADMVESMATEGDADEDGEGSVSKINKSPEEPPKKKAKVSETLMAGLTNIADKLVTSLEMSNSTLVMLGGRMGYAHDLSAKRSVVNVELEKIKAGLAITKDAQMVDHFYSLKTKEEKLIRVQTMLDCGF